MTRYKQVGKISYELLDGKTPKQNIINQLEVLITTPVGTLFLDRDFGMDFSPLDKPLSVAVSMFTSLLADKIDTYIPDIKLSHTELSHSLDEPSKIHIKVVIEYAL